MATVDQHAELDLPGTSLLEEGIHGGAHGTSGIKDVIDQDDVLAGDGEFHLRFLHYRRGSHGREIVAIQSDIERAHGHLRLFDPPNHLSQALGEEYSATADSYQAKVGR